VQGRAGLREPLRDWIRAVSRDSTIDAFEASLHRYSWPIVKSAMRQMMMVTVDFFACPPRG
jgi:hypothetical protein